MKLYPALIPNISRDAITRLLEKNPASEEGQTYITIEDQNKIPEAEKDVGAVIRSYLEVDREIQEEAQRTLKSKGLEYKELGAIKRGVAQRRNHPMGDDAIDFLVNQVIEALYASNNIDEIWAEDHELRRQVVLVFRNYLTVDEEVDKEARRRIKNLQEGTLDWEVAYDEQVSRIKRVKGLIK
ncbi:MAG: hypothetical protein GMKNLPBB_00751 [Myxococcota bacterium]|nr:hypothetical protein [Myxococcota bacterium]